MASVEARQGEEESRLELSAEVISVPQISATLIPISVHLLAISPTFKRQPYNTFRFRVAVEKENDFPQP